MSFGYTSSPSMFIISMQIYAVAYFLERVFLAANRRTQGNAKLFFLSVFEFQLQNYFRIVPSNLLQ